jgi:hypothetical protein
MGIVSSLTCLFGELSEFQRALQVRRGAGAVQPLGGERLELGRVHEATGSLARR